jgi:hypothetical protein
MNKNYILILIIISMGIGAYFFFNNEDAVVTNGQTQNYKIPIILE